MATIILNAKEHLKNINKVLELLDNKSIPKQVRVRIEELLNLEDDSITIDSWKDLIDYSNELTPDNASVAEVEYFEKSISDICKGL